MSQTGIDYMVTNINASHCIMEILETDLSDHFAVALTLTVEKEIGDSYTDCAKESKRCVTDQNIQAFKAKLQRVDWNSLYNNDNADKMFDEFMENVLWYFDMHCPRTY